MVKRVRKITKSFLDKIKSNTNLNAHGINLEFISRYIGSPLAPKFRKINTAHLKLGYMDESLSKGRFQLSKKLKSELIKKYPQQYTLILRRL